MSDEVTAKETVEKAEEVKVEGANEKPKFVAPVVFLDEDQTSDIEVDVIADAVTGKIMYVLPRGAAKQEDDRFFSFTPYKFKFSCPNWEQLSLYRKNSSINEKGQIDKSTFRTYLLANHLKEWDIRDSKGDLVELDFDKIGDLSKESLSKINRVPPVILDAVLTLVEREFGLGSN